jgi:hypothetical protein
MATEQGCGSKSALFLEAGSGSALEIKSWFRIRIKVQIQKFYRLKIEKWRAVDAQNGALEGL